MTNRFADVTAAAVQAFHTNTAGVQPIPSTAPRASDDVAWMGIATNHRCNCLLWAEEDDARRTNVPDSAIAANKRAIDRYNQQRNDAVEQIDAALLARLADVAPRADAWQQSETAGAMIDRLSILSLKVYNMTREAHRADASGAHRAACAEKLTRLVAQRDDLGRCYDALLARAEEGRVFWRVYRQFKMYNDPALNPSLYRG
jgi:hypothetical protein